MYPKFLRGYVTEALTIPHVRVADWLVGRRPSALSTNFGTALPAFQAWRNFKEAFAPELVARAFDETTAATGRPVRKTVDPFGGSGTTALGSQFLGARPTTVEVNPFLADLIEAKLASYDVESLLADHLSVITSEVDASDFFPGAPETFVEPGLKGRWLFSRSVAARLAGLRNAILQLSDVGNMRLLRVLLASIAVEASNVVVSGKGRRYRRNWAERSVTPDDVLAAFNDAFRRAIYDIRRFQHRACLDFELVRGDARVVTPTEGDFDLCIFSPPYPNSFDYTDVYNVELWVAGYLDSSQSNRSLREKTLRSHVQIKRSFEVVSVPSGRLAETVAALAAARSTMWNKSIPEMVGAYFDDMVKVLLRLHKCLRPGARAYMIVGDSRYQGIVVPVGEILAELSCTIGFELISHEALRTMRSSPQQGGKEQLVESMITLRRA